MAKYYREGEAPQEGPEQLYSGVVQFLDSRFEKQDEVPIELKATSAAMAHARMRAEIRMNAKRYGYQVSKTPYLAVADIQVQEPPLAA